MANTKEYKIVINGLTESINAVENLNSKLETLEKRINAVAGKSIPSGGGGSSSRGGNASSLSEEEAIQREINKLKAEGEKLDAKIAATQSEIYQKVQATKDLYKEAIADQKQIAAQERIVANTYSNTMVGMKQKLADLKTVHFTTDISTDEFKQQEAEINSLTNKLKELEEAYGKSAADGFKGLAIQVGDATKEFDNAKQALKELDKEMKTLSTKKDMGLISEEEAKRLEELIPIVAQLKSSIQDAGKPMDALMDTMESFVAISSISAGFSALFGLDDSEIEKSIQKLVALQNVLQGIEKINKQIQSQEGIGKYLARGSEGVDRFVASMTGAKNTVSGLTMSSRAATVAVKGLSFALKSIGVGVAFAAVNMLMQALERITKMMNPAKSATDALEASMKALNAQFDARTEALRTSFMKGELTDEQYLADIYKTQNDYINESIRLLNERARIANDKSWYDKFNINESNTGYTGQKLTGETTFGTGHLWSFGDYDFSYTVKNIEEARKAWTELNDAVSEGKDYFEKYGEGFTGWLKSLTTTVKETEELMHGPGNAILSDLESRIQEAGNEYTQAMNDVSRGVEGAQDRMNKAKKAVSDLANEMNNDKILQSIITNLDKYIPEEGVRKQLEAILNHFQDFNTKINEASVEQIHFWNNKRIAAMADGQAKINAQIDEDLRYEKQKYGDSAEHMAILEAEAQRKRLNAMKKGHDEAKKKAEQHSKDMAAAQSDLEKLRIDAMEKGEKKAIAQLENEKKERIKKVVQSGILVGERRKLIEKIYNQKILDEQKKWAAEYIKTYEDLRKSIDDVMNKTRDMNLDTQSSENQRKTAEAKRNAGSNFNQGNYNDTDAIRKYYSDLLTIELSAATEEKRINLERLNNQRETEEKLENERHNALIGENGEYKKQLDNNLITRQQYDKLIEDENKAHTDAMSAITESYGEQEKAIVENNLRDIQSKYQEYWDGILSDVSNTKEEIDEKITKATVTNGLDIVNLSATKKNLNQAKSEVQTKLNEINIMRAVFEQQWKAGLISREVYTANMTRMNELEKGLKASLESINNEMKEMIPKFVQSCTVYIQGAIDSFQTIMSALWDAQDAEFEREQEQLDKLNEELENKLREQQEIVQEHTSNIDSIEDELATARGSRRDALIEKLNAEMAAQKAAQKEEQKIQKEKEKAEAKQYALEKKRKKEQYKRDILQAIVNGAMAVTMAAVNKWPIPAIPMMALAGATTAAQLAIMMANKPYAKGGQLDGGVAVGARHKDGGIPVLGGRASIEGGEFITNRVSTSKNVDVLEYINSKKRKLNLDDFVDFYSSGNVRKNITSISPKRMFADGGTIPTLRNDITLNDKLLAAFEDYSDRPVYVTVKDINERQEAVRNVQVLAGLE